MSTQTVDGRYQLLRQLGQGGGGAVWLARDVDLGRDVALKVAHARLEERTRLDRFKREGAIVARLEHPGIVGVHAAGVWNGHPYLAFELVAGARDLRSAGRELSLEARAGLVLEAARALAHAHAQGVVHRDVKPGNLLVDDRGRVRVADFGVATAQELEQLTRTGALVGTPSYMSPEQLVGQPAGPTSDVWALGVVLYELLTGVLPFQAEGLIELARIVNETRCVPPRELDGQVSPGIEAVCLRALARDPARRQPDAGAFADELEAALRGDQQRPGRRRLVWVLLLPTAALAIGSAVLVATSVSPLEPIERREPPPSPPPPPPPPVDLSWRLVPGDVLRVALAGRQRGGGATSWVVRGVIEAPSSSEVEADMRIEECYRPELVGSKIRLALERATGRPRLVRGLADLVPRGSRLEEPARAADASMVENLTLLLHLLPGRPVSPDSTWQAPFDLGRGQRGERTCELRVVEGGRFSIISRLAPTSSGSKFSAIRGETTWHEGRLVRSVVTTEQPNGVTFEHTWEMEER